MLRVALHHLTTEACLAELRRNAGLRQLIGIESESGVPKKWNISRFELVLGQEPFRTLAHNAFDTMARRLAEAVPDLGKSVAGDSTTLNARDRQLRQLPQFAAFLPYYAGQRNRTLNIQRPTLNLFSVRCFRRRRIRLCGECWMFAPKFT